MSTWTVCQECASGACGLCTLDACDCRRTDMDGHVIAAEQAYAEQRPLPTLDAPDWYTQERMPLLDERDAAAGAIAKVKRNAAPWIATATEALRRVALRRTEVTSDDVWLELRRAGVVTPHDTRAIGAVMRHGIEVGWLDPTPVNGNTRPKIWRSAIQGRYDLIRHGNNAAA